MTQRQAVAFSALPNWADDDHAQALTAFLRTADLLQSTSLYNAAKTATDPRRFFETYFQPHIIGGDVSAHFTGYYEPVVAGAQKRGGIYQTPLYAVPPDLIEGQTYYSRAEIAAGALEERGLELVWLADPVDAFFMQVQGSGCVALDSGEHRRLGFGAKNGHPYCSLGAEMIRRGVLNKQACNADTIKAWLRKHVDDCQDLLNHNPSYIFFKTRDEAIIEPIGAMGRGICAGRSIAVDPAYNPLGLPVYIDKHGRDPLRRLMIAHDVGSAIIGAQRCDIYFGSGDDAGHIAGNTNAHGQMYLFLPKVCV